MTVYKKGSRRSEYVRTIQKQLNQLNKYPKLTVDGYFGDNTDRIVRMFQREYGLLVDGKVGPQTQTALRQAVRAPKPAKPEPDKSAMNNEPPEGEAKPVIGTPPPNAASLKLLDTDRPISGIIFHCAATPEGKDFTVEDIRSWHKQRGFSDIGYHYVVYRDGRIMLGRPIGQIGAHVEGHNTGTIGICYIGGVTKDGKKPKDTRTALQKSSLLWLRAQLEHKFNIKTVKGHNDYTNAKACPSFKVGNDQLGAALN